MSDYAALIQPTRLNSEVRISSNEAQILEICQDFVEKNVKKGWVKVA
jgi:hypothetical protein